jgi:hypothetical protein
MAVAALLPYKASLRYLDSDDTMTEPGLHCEGCFNLVGSGLAFCLSIRGILEPYSPSAGLC